MTRDRHAHNIRSLERGSNRGARFHQHERHLDQPPDPQLLKERLSDGVETSELGDGERRRVLTCLRKKRREELGDEQANSSERDLAYTTEDHQIASEREDWKKVSLQTQAKTTP